MHEKRFSGDIARLRSGEQVERLEVRRVIELSLEGGSFRHILDVGTGSGLFAEGYSRHSLDVIGVDANHETLPDDRSYVPQGRFLQATAEELPFTSRSFDLAFYGLILHEADDPPKVLQAAHRVSRKRVCLLEWPYKEQTFGPPLSDRLSPVRLEEIFNQIGFAHWECVQLANTVLYMLDSDLA